MLAVIQRGNEMLGLGLLGTVLVVVLVVWLIRRGEAFALKRQPRRICSGEVGSPLPLKYAEGDQRDCSSPGRAMAARLS